MKIVYLGWDCKLVDAVADNLLSEGKVWDGTLVLVPTRESASALLQTLARRGGAVMPPLVRTTEMLLGDLHADGALAQQALLWAWSEAIRRESHLEELVRLEPEERTTSWALSLAETCLQIRRELNESLIDFTAVSDHPFVPAPEKGRWKTLSRLEANARRLLASWGVPDPMDAERQWALEPRLDETVSRVILACVPDPLPLVMQALSRLEELGLVSCECWVHAPEAIRVDAWGRPDAAQWEPDHPARPVIELPDSAFRVAADGRGMADELVRDFIDYEASSDASAVGMVDDSFVSVVESALDEAGWPVFRTAGYEAAGTGIAVLLRHLGELVHDPDAWPPMDALCRSSLVATLLDLDDPWAFACALDRIVEKHLPSRVSLVRRKLQDTAALDKVMEWVRRWLEGPVGEAAAALAAGLRRRDWSGRFQEGLLNELAALAARISKLERLLPLAPADAFLLLCRGMERLRVYDDRSKAAIKLEHWLDLSFDPADHVALAGMHEGSVPDMQADHPLLPDSLKKALNLRSRADRFARDGLLFAGLVMSRRERGRVGVLTSRVDLSGNPCTPSSLLFLCRDGYLPGRVQLLYDDRKEAVPSIPYDRSGWKWRVDPAPRTWTVLTPSAIKSFLSCPMRFWLDKVEGLRRLDSGVSAIKAGNAVHACVEQLGPDRRLYSLTSEEELSAGLLDELDHYYTRQYGEQLSLPLLVQKDYARARLERFALFHLQALDEGWEVMAVEHELEYAPWPDLPVTLRMRLDRVERHVDGRLRIVDFKTRKKVIGVRDAHMEKLGQQARKALGECFPTFPEWLDETGRKPVFWRWKDLQLPLYLMAARAKLAADGKDSKVIPAYFNMPLTWEGTGYQEWSELDGELYESAMTWARSIAMLLQDCPFDRLPSAERLGWKTVFPSDPFAALSPEGMEELAQRGTAKGGPA